MATNGITTPLTHTAKPWRKTPLIHSTALSRAAGCNIYLKLENLQPSGSFKSRGIGNFMVQSLLHAPKTSASSTTASKPTHFYSSSGGNAGLACVHAAVTLQCASTIIVPLTISAYMISKMRTAGATDVIQTGESWADADRHLRETVLAAAKQRDENAVYVPPFDHEDIWAGNATMVDEILADFASSIDGTVTPDPEGPDARLPDAIICSVGGGGMFCGIMQGLDRHAVSDKVGVLALETRGADSLSAALLAGSHVTLPAITSIATTLGARQVARRAYELGQRKNVTSVVLEDRDAVFGCAQLADEERLLVEPSCGVCVAMCYEGRLKKHVAGLNRNSNVVVVVCGGTGVTVNMMEQWREKYL